MSFDKNKAMRNAERFLSQGKIRGAINEYQRVVENDPRDYSTLNILGDLYAKNRDTQQAVGCFTQVAEHYNTQGFSHKAIAIYNKISRIEPGSIEISAKLAELYQMKGSVAEARVHYTKLAEHYQKKGQKIEALAIWKQIAELDPNNTEIYLKIAETCWQEEQFDEAARAFTEAGLRFLKQEKFESALAAFSRTLEIKKHDLRALKGLVKTQIGLGCADEAANALEEVLKEQPHNRDILYLLVDCYIDMDNPQQAERTVIKLVEQEPANYPKFLELVKIYIKKSDLNAATRILSMSSEHLLVGGQSEEFLEWTNEILARNPEQIDALRLLVRHHSWQRDTSALKQALERLAEVSRLNESAEDEHYALSQLVMIAPQEIGHAQRLQELNSKHGFAADLPLNEVVAADSSPVNEIPQFENFNAPEANETNGYANEFNFADVSGSYDFNVSDSSHSDSADNTKDFAFYDGAVETTAAGNNFAEYRLETFANAPGAAENQLSHTDALLLQKEIDSIEFYIEQGYRDLAAKSLDELESRFGSQPQISELRLHLGDSAQAAIEVEYPTGGIFENDTVAEKSEIVESGNVAAYPIIEEAKSAKNNGTPKNDTAIGSGLLDELKDEFSSLEETKQPDTDEDYETHYHMATAYKEMGLMEKAIKEFQDAIHLVEVNDETRRFFQCVNLLGHCFMEKNMPKAAVKWLLRSLEVADLTDEEKHAVYYELGNAFEANGDYEKAIAYFEQLYSENIDYRNVSERLEKLQMVNA